VNDGDIHDRSPTMADVLDRILDKGIVIEYRADVSVLGLYMLTVRSEVTVMSIDTELRYATGSLQPEAVARAVEEYLRRVPPA